MDIQRLDQTQGGVPSIRLTAFVALMVMLSASTAWAGDDDDQWEVDGDRSSLRFVSDAPMEKIVGTSEQLQGTIEFDVDNPSDLDGTIKFPVDSMRTGNSTRDRHLTQEDWLHAEEYPHVSFEVVDFDNVEIARTDDRVDVRGTVTGNVEVRGVSKEHEVDIQFAVLPEQNLARVQPELSIRLADHDVAGADNTIGTEVGEVIEVTMTIYANRQ